MMGVHSLHHYDGFTRYTTMVCSRTSGSAKERKRNPSRVSVLIALSVIALPAIPLVVTVRRNSSPSTTQAALGGEEEREQGGEWESGRGKE
jgi:hypothetical protein